MLTLDISRETRAQTPDDASLERAARMALCHGRPEGRQDWELSLRIVDDEEMRELNGRYRGKDRPTNVLSFSAELPDAVDLPLLGDIVICAPVVNAAKPRRRASCWRRTGTTCSFTESCICWVLITKPMAKQQKWKHSKPRHCRDWAGPAPTPRHRCWSQEKSPDER
jgi:ssRNA-specific RNase YbeY (16S rRNA maturation enzyme)